MKREREISLARALTRDALCARKSITVCFNRLGTDSMIFCLAVFPSKKFQVLLSCAPLNFCFFSR
jgi:hypothetical protein